MRNALQFLPQAEANASAFCPQEIKPVQFRRGQRDQSKESSPSDKGRKSIRPFVLAKDMARAFAKQFYSSKAWQDCRDGYAAYRGHLCEYCLRRGLYTPGEVVHHVIELTPNNITDPGITLNWDNLRLVCRECHIKAHDHRMKDRRYTFGPGGEVIIDELV